MRQVSNNQGKVKNSAALARYWDHTEDEILRDLWGLVPLQNIAERLGRSYGATQRRARWLKIPKLQSRRNFRGEFTPTLGAKPRVTATISLPKLKFIDGEGC